MRRSATMPPAAILRECFDYDPTTGALTWRVRPVAHFQSQARAAWWNRRWAGREVRGSLCSRYGHRQVTFTVRRTIYRILTNRLAWALVHGGPPIGDVTRWDPQTGSNTPSNLRQSTKSQTARDSRRRKPGLKGAYRTKGGKWTSCVWVGGRHRHLGTFPTEQAAHEAWVVANVKVAGRFFNAGYLSVFD